VRWMLRDGGLRLASGQLVIGPKAEKRFGRRNFMELYAVFSSPQTYTVETGAGQPLGTLNQAFVDRLVDGISCFLLSGRAWAVLHVRHDDRRVVVQPAPRGKKPTWGGFLPQFLGFEVCQRVLRILTDDAAYPYLDEAAARVLVEHRDSMPSNLAPRRGGVEFEGDEIRWWTFAGGRINATLRYALEAIGGDWKVIPDNFLIKIRGETANRDRFEEALGQLRELEFWENDKLWSEVAESLPTYRLSKFQPLMPPWMEREVVASYLLDVGGAWRWISDTDTGPARLPRNIGQLTPEEEHRAERLELEPATEYLRRDAKRELVWIRTDEELSRAAGALLDESVIGLNVKTTLGSRSICLIQLAAAERTFLIDALDVPNIEELRPVLEGSTPRKVIHNARFEREVLGRFGLSLERVVDTLELSREKRGVDAAGGHGLRAVVERELGRDLDERLQTSDWSARPLSDAQVEYAALDAEVLLQLRERLGDAEAP